MAKLLFLAAALALGLYLLLLLAVYLGQRGLQYFPSHDDREGRGRPPFSAWKSESGAFLGYCRAPARPKRVLLFFHGNGGEALHREWVAQVTPESFVLCLVEYPGYGARPGSPTEPSILAAAEEAFDEATRRWAVPVRVAGESLGSGAATYLASRRPVERLALLSPFTAAEDVAALHYPYLPVRWLMKDRFRSIDRIAEVKAPIHVIHGEADDLIPPAQGRRLHDAYRGASRAFTAVPGVGHNDLAAAVMVAPAAADFRVFVAGEQ